MILEQNGLLLKWKSKYLDGDPNKCKTQNKPNIKYTLKHLNELQIVSACGLGAAALVLFVEVIWHYHYGHRIMLQKLIHVINVILNLISGKDWVNVK